MTNPTHPTRIALRATFAVALLGMAAVAACDQNKLLTAPTPDVVLPGDIASRAALPSAFASAVGDFQLAYAGGYGGQTPLLDYNEGFAQMTALLTDEMLNAETYNTRIEVDRRATTIINQTTLQTFQVAQQARATADLDIWIRPTASNAERVLAAVQAFGFDLPSLQSELFINPRSVVRFGVPPFRIEVMTSIDGVEFGACRERAVEIDLDGVSVPVISLADLKANKRAAGRHKDLADLENLP